jgi:hypothetical protein
MPKFLAVYPLQAPAAFEEVAPVLAKRAKAASSVDAYWVCSWCQLDEAGKITKLFCQWNASSIEAVRNAVCGRNVPLPLEDVYPMAVVDPEDFK